MGGDDLGSDDEFLNPSIQDTAEDKLSEKVEREQEKKRKRGDDDDDDAPADEVPTKKSSMKVLIEAGRGLDKKPADVQAAFLWMTLKHYVQMKGDSINGLLKIEQKHFTTSDETAASARVKDCATSMKKLKNWKPIGSPMILIVCISARRAVAILKEIASLKIRAAKLFAKHLDIKDQREMLTNNCFGIAVGTPNRLKMLCQPEQGHSKAPLNLGKTTLVLLDSHSNQKGYTVCTLPDTAPDTMDFFKEQVVPQLKARKDIRLAFL
jgi:hypothetical protein